MRPSFLRSAWLLRIATLPIAWCSVQGLRATNYYVSPSGNDASNGTSEATAWRTIDRVNQSTYTFQPGDRILLQRGGTFRGQIILGSSGTAAAPITVGAYGSGDLPVVSGSAAISGWTVHEGAIWVAEVAQKVDQLYANGQRLTPARFPDTGWLRNSQGGGTQLRSNDLTQPDGYWNGARAVVRSTSSSYDTVVVANYVNGTLTFTSSVNNMGTDPWGFFLCKRLSELDAPGEWFYDGIAGRLYAWLPGNADPNGALMEASVHWAGVLCSWQRHYLNVENITFRHQQNAGIRNDGADHVTVTGCTFERLYHGIRSYGSADVYSANTFRNTYASAALLIDNGTTFSNNDLIDIALIPGEGETAWGYFGVRSIGQDNIIRRNRLDNIGYTGLEVNGNAQVERNTIQRTLATLNDGGGIAFDNADGLRVIDNIVSDVIGNYEGSATNEPHNHHMGIGIYFGNTSIKNTTVQGNTVSGCPGAGLNVDHTMGATGYLIKDNVLFNNAIQLAVSDFSNYNGPSAVPPYFVPSYDDVFSGNVLYALKDDQLVMKQFNCYSATPVDFGTFTDNRYFNPYNELSILVHNIYSGGPKYYSLERWKAERNEDLNSTRSPLRLNGNEVVEVFGGELVQNGTFVNNVSGWGGWPTNATATHDVDHLDNGCLKANLPNNSVYPEYTLRNPDAFAVESGAWYRLRFSLQSNAPGELNVGIKGVSQLSNGNTISKRAYAFDSERRDLEFLFQSSSSDQGLAEFTNRYTDPKYWLDNVSVQRVAVQPVDPSERQVLLVNNTTAEKNFPLTGCWSDVNGATHQQHVTLGAFRSIVLVKEDATVCASSTTGVNETTTAAVDHLLFPNPVQHGGSLYFERPTSGTLSVFTVNGALAFTEQLPASCTRIDVPATLAPGAYAVRIVSGNAVQRHTLVVE